MDDERVVLDGYSGTFFLVCWLLSGWHTVTLERCMGSVGARVLVCEFDYATPKELLQQALHCCVSKRLPCIIHAIPDRTSTHAIPDRTKE